MKKVIFKHKKTEDLVIKKDDNFYILNDDCKLKPLRISSNTILDDEDWECITSHGRGSYELLLDKNNMIYFKSVLTDKEFHIGDEITIKDDISYADGKRNFIIDNFYISDIHKSGHGNIFEYVFVHTNKGRGIHLSSIKINKSN